MFSEPFIAADDVAAQRLMVQTAAISDEFRKRLSWYTLYRLADFDPAGSEPLEPLPYPVDVASGDRLVAMVEQSERLISSNKGDCSNE